MVNLITEDMARRIEASLATYAGKGDQRPFLHLWCGCPMDQPDVLHFDLQLPEYGHWEQITPSILDTDGSVSITTVYRTMIQIMRRYGIPTFSPPPGQAVDLDLTFRHSEPGKHSGMLWAFPIFIDHPDATVKRTRKHPAQSRP